MYSIYENTSCVPTGQGPIRRSNIISVNKMLIKHIYTLQYLIILYIFKKSPLFIYNCWFSLLMSPVIFATWTSIIWSDQKCIAVLVPKHSVHWWNTFIFCFPVTAGRKKKMKKCFNFSLFLYFGMLFCVSAFVRSSWKLWLYRGFAETEKLK